MQVNTPIFNLNTSAKIPGIGFGTWQSTDQEAYDAVISAIKAGYRHIDTAHVYGNESIIGKAIKDSGIPRNELFVTTKLWATDCLNPKEALKGSLERLGLDYVDLYLMHWPVAMNPNGNNKMFPTKDDGSRDIIDRTYIDTYKDMEKLLNTNMTKAIGISNFTINKLQNLLNEITNIPAVLQIELHPYLPQQELVDFCSSKGIIVEGYSPLGSTGAPILKEQILVKLADKYNVSPANICISWAIWRKTIPLPKSTNPSRIASNLKYINLSDEDGKSISELYKTTGIHRYVSPQWGVQIFD
ncbi:hypothetical protein C6P40_004052 [Pichia californica]|uniref:2-dehydropantolactone reductase n=1 Tax=Pichia californica TaxID=460514 RepID=A0A9P7BGG0_9ASCO|nr:hypothetical protein C6P42_001117 [[Candida] californica]KAG0690001.1 hypothetical protein C6P40_004052 [[Candida] californica]